MRLADFILRDMEAILVAWEAFASVQLPAARHMKSLALRDHARQILEAVAKDLSDNETRCRWESRAWTVYRARNCQGPWGIYQSPVRRDRNGIRGEIAAKP
jgi:hypothetical protein